MQVTLDTPFEPAITNKPSEAHMKKNFEVSISLLVEAESAEDARQLAEEFAKGAMVAWDTKLVFDPNTGRPSGEIHDDVVVCDPSEVFEDNRSEVA